MNARVTTIVRYVLGIMLFVFGLNKFASFLPPLQLTGGLDFMTALVKSGYLMAMVGLVEMVVGGLLLANRYVPLALQLLAPVSVNIMAFHIFLEPGTMVPGAFVFLANLYLLFAYKSYYSGVLTANAVAQGEPQSKVHA